LLLSQLVSMIQKGKEDGGHGSGALSANTTVNCGARAANVSS